MATKNPWVFRIALGFAVVVFMLFIIALFNHWFGYNLEDVIEFCEAPRKGLVKEPANTWSNLGFIISGLYIAWTLSSGTFVTMNNSFTRNRFYAMFYPCVVIFLGPGSMAKHATKTSIGGFFDMLSMYLMASFIVAYALQRFCKLRWWAFTVIFTLVLASCIWANFTHCTIVFNFFGNTAFAFYLTMGLIIEGLNVYVKKLSHQNKWAWYSLGALMVSFTIWNLSLTGTSFCNPDSLLQGHAVWHLGTALAAYFLFRYYVSENINYDIAKATS